VGPALALIWAITASATLLQAANGLLLTLLPLRMQAQGLSITGIGVVTAAYGLGFLLGCFLGPLVIRRVGHIRAFASLAVIVAVIILGFTLADSVAAWAILRALMGVGMAGLLTIIDGWISGRAISSHRGRIIAIYTICTKIAMMLSPLGIALGSVEADGLFMAVNVTMALSLLPVATSVTEEPPAPRSVRLDLRGLFKVAPSAVVGAFVVGTMNAPVIAVAPVYGVRVGLTSDQAAVLLFALQGGSLLFQWPLGWLSDRFDRRLIIAGIAAGTAVVSLAILGAGSLGPIFLTIAFALWGGLSLCLYPVCAAHAADLVEPDRIVPTVSSLLVCWAVGSILGPLPATAMMGWLGPGGLFIYIAVMALLLAAFVSIRIARHARPAAGGGFVDIVPTSPATATLTARGERTPAQKSPAESAGP
jgi:MFS family permease